MDLWQRNLRIIHQISEFVDLDAHGSDRVADLIGLIDAMREGLTQIDEQLCIPDTQINLLFLTKLKARPPWTAWATAMLHDGAADRLAFRELADRALQREADAADPTGTGTRTGTGTGGVPQTDQRQSLTQEDINAFVVRQMRRSHSGRGHAKRPSQAEINDYVVRQMRRDQERTTRARSHSQPEPRTQQVSASEPAPTHQDRRPRPRCTFCGDASHQVGHCWRRWRVAVEAPQGQYVPKRVEFRTEVPGQPPTYRSGFMLY